MIIPPRIGAPPHRGVHRARPGDPDWPSFTAGAGALLVLFGFCLFCLTHLAR